DDHELLPEPARQALVHRGDLPRARAAPRDRVEVSGRICGGVLREEARMDVSATDAAAVVRSDLADIVDRCSEELGGMGGRRLLITGGAGFLGHYLVQGALAWNAATDGEPIDLVVLDNYQRGVPDWLEACSDDPNLTLVEHDIRHPLPDNIGHFEFVVHA